MSQTKTSGSGKMFVSRAGWFSFRYPPEWQVDEDSYVAIYKPEDGVGALHISAYSVPELADPKKELLEHLSDKRIEGDHIIETLDGTKRIASVGYLSDGSFDKVWFISDDSYLVLATYTVDEADREKELEDIENIVRSLEILPNISRN